MALFSRVVGPGHTIRIRFDVDDRSPSPRAIINRLIVDVLAARRLRSPCNRRPALAADRDRYAAAGAGADDRRGAVTARR